MTWWMLWMGLSALGTLALWAALVVAARDREIVDRRWAETRRALDGLHERR